MYIQFLVEDLSGGVLIDKIMTHYKADSNVSDFDYDIKTYKGIGKYNIGLKAEVEKSNYLLTELPKRIRAYHYKYVGKSDVSLFIVLDNDTHVTEDFYKQLYGAVTDRSISIDRVFCIAIEEVEAWLLGDFHALVKAYPNLEDRIRQKHSQYIQDEIRNGGTWEFLYELLNPRKGNKTGKTNLLPGEVGRLKSEWANRIGTYMNVRNNASQSFNYFISELDLRCVNTLQTSLRKGGSVC
jgi:hypothetical protein